MKTAVLLIAHGSRQKEANQDLYYVVSELRRLQEYAIVEACFLELADPDIAAGGQMCVAQGANRVIAVPYFLSAGIHVRRDLAAARDALADKFPHVDFHLGEPFGRHPLLLQIVRERIRQSIPS